MKILWFTNVPLPEASTLMSEAPQPYGGWLIEIAKILAVHTDISLSIAFPHKGKCIHEKLVGEKICYYPFRWDPHFAGLGFDYTDIERIIGNVNPDLIHVFGSELPHCQAVVRAGEQLQIKTVITIQGLVSILAKHTHANLPSRVVWGATLRNLLLGDSVDGMRNLFEKRGRDEIDALRRVRYVIGRTSWDNACVRQINPNVTYFFCNETLREEYYMSQWDLDFCEEHSMFLSQGQYSIKGLHFVLEAMPTILKQYPCVKLYVAGKNIIACDTLREKVMLTYYGKYIGDMIRRNNLQEHVVFLGLLDSTEMCARHIKSHVFVCPSSIENSPNSLGEAMILGVPSVASYVGGIPDMLTHGIDGFLYQHDAPYMLAHYVCAIFRDRELAAKLSFNARSRALKRHHADTNVKTLLDIYAEIMAR